MRFSISLRGLARSKEIPSEIEASLVKFRHELVIPLVEDMRRTEPRGDTWPKGRRKTIQQQTKGIVRGPSVIIGTFHSRFARSLDAGGTVEPRPGKTLRYKGPDDGPGEFHFTRKPIYHAPRPFFGRVLSQVPVIVTTVYERVFSEIGRGK